MEINYSTYSTYSRSILALGTNFKNYFLERNLGWNKWNKWNKWNIFWNIPSWNIFEKEYKY